MNYKQLSAIAEDLLKGLRDGSLNSIDAKEQNNCIGKINNLYKSKLEYEINRHKMAKIDFFEDNISQN